MRRWVVAAGWAVALSALPTAATAARPSGSSTPSARTIADEVRAAGAWAKEIGVHVVNLATGATVFAEDAATPRVLASNTKLLTTAAALDLLGSSYEFETRVLLRGPVENGVLRGDVAILGGGDPTISGRFHDGDEYFTFRAWAEALQKRGVRSIEGQLVLVDGVFDPQHVHPDWPRDQLTRWYEAPIGGLSFNDNCVLVRVWPGAKAGDLARVEIAPPLAEITVNVTARTTSTRRKHAIGVSRAIDGDALTVSGAVYHRGGPFEAWVAVRSPHQFFGWSLRDAWRRAGLPISGKTERADYLPEGAWEVVTEWRSPLGAALAVTNKRSQNLYAETLFKLVGAAGKGAGTWETGVEAVSAFLERVGVVKGTFALRDGSGLSQGNRLAPEQMTRLLAFMFHHPAGREYLASLAFSGEVGLRWQRRLATPPYRGNVFAKTGTLNGVSTLSGYAKGRSGTLYAFSILLNKTRANWRAEQAQDAIVRAIVNAG